MDASKDLGILIKQIHDLMEKTSNEQLRERDMTLSQLRIMFFLHGCSDKTASLKEIEKHFQVAQPTVVGIMKRLECKGFISIIQDSYDKRVKNAILTDKGDLLCKESDFFRVEMELKLTRGLNPSEIAELYRLLIVVNKNLLR